MNNLTLLENIEFTRNQLLSLFDQKKSLLDPTVIYISQELDKLIVEYQQAV